MHPGHLNEPVTNYISKDFCAVNRSLTVEEALEQIRREGVGEKIIYFYVVDETGRLSGVLPTRRLLAAALQERIADLMVRQVVAIPQSATVLDASEMFVLYKFLAFPVVDSERRLVGVIDIAFFAREVLNIAEHERVDDVFQAIGFHVEQVQHASPAKAFEYRFPWLLATVASGTIAAILATFFEATLAEALVLAFFLTLVLGLGESVAIQSMTVTLHALHLNPPSFRFYTRALAKEVKTALMLGACCGALVGVISAVSHGFSKPALVIGASLVLTLTFACVVGLSVPTLLHHLKLDPKIASGPITLGLADIFTLLIYFSMAALLL